MVRLDSLLLLTTLVFAVTLAVVPVQPVWAAFPGINGRIGFTRATRDDICQIYSMDSDGFDLIELTDDQRCNSAPSWSPDGSMIVFDAVREEEHWVVVMNADGSGQKWLADSGLAASSGWSSEPVWSPDGRIAFTGNNDSNIDIYVMNADGSGQINLTHNAADDDNPAWSPDGSKIAFQSSRDGNREIYVMNVDGSGVARLTDNPAVDNNPEWSPDARRIAFASKRDGDFEIYIMNADGSGQTQLTNNAIYDNHPAWSPDGDKIAFTSQRDEYLQIYVMNVDGSDQTKITENATHDSDPDWQPVVVKQTTTALQTTSSATYVYVSTAAPLQSALLGVILGLVVSMPVSVYRHRKLRS